MQNTIVIDGEISLIISETGDCDLILPECAEVGIVTMIREGALPAYTGESVVTPKAFQSTVLGTANKSVYQDIEVLEIPYTEVSNPSGGYTVSIG